MKAARARRANTLLAGYATGAEAQAAVDVLSAASVCSARAPRQFCLIGSVAMHVTYLPSVRLDSFCVQTPS
jgi:hypothetical protein